MSAVDDAIAHAQELLEGLGPISARKMFGGAGLYRGGVIFAVIVKGEVMVKADAKSPLGAALIEDLEAAGAERWTYEGKKGLTGMPYWRLPDSALDDPDEATRWAERSLVALGS